jgi:hypothetical protein
MPSSRHGLAPLLQVILRFSAVIQRYRRWVLLTAVAIDGSAVFDAVQATSEPAGALVAAGAATVER